MIAGLWLVLLACSSLALLAVPMVPAWREWSRPTDSTSLAVETGYAAQADFFASRLRQLLAEHLLRVPARSLVPAEWPGATAPILMGASVALHSRVAASAPVIVEGDFDAPAGGTFTALLASGDIRLGAGSEITQWVHSDRSLRIGADSVALRRASCSETLEIESGGSFERLHARVISFGARAVSAGRRERAGTSAELSEVPNIVRRAPGVYRGEGDCALPDDTRFEGSLVVTGALTIGAGATVRGDIKARKAIIVGPGATIDGAITCEGVIHIHERAFVKGPIIAEMDVWVDAGAELGAPLLPTTVTAENIIVSDGVVAYGTVHARDAGIVWSPA